MKDFRLSAIMVLIILVVPASSFAQEGADTVRHIGISAAFGGISETLLHYKTNLSPLKRITIATIIGSVPGLVKEIHDDIQTSSKFSGSDMAADVAGAFSGSVMAQFINSRIRVNVTKLHGTTKISLAYRF